MVDYKTFDPDLWAAIAKEEERQEHNLELIASENFVSEAVMAAQGSILTNKYAEGYPGLHPNPVPYADITTTTTHKTLRGPRGGMILTNDEALAKKINSAVFPGIQGGPLEHVIAGKAVAFKEALDPAFKEYSEQIIANAKAMVKVFNQAIGTRVISGATDNHLMLIDVRELGINGKESESILDSVNITVNKNSIPFETLSPFKTSGIRIGTPAITTRGFKEEDAVKVAELVVKALQAKDDNAQLDEVKTGVRELTEKFPLHKK